MPSSIKSDKSTPRKSRVKTKRKVPEREVLVHGSLPPQVDGQIRCFVVVKLGVTWKHPSPPAVSYLRAVWWGERHDSAAIFSPSEKRVIGRYPVRSGPKQMSQYLADAGSISVEVLRGSDMSVIGKSKIYGLSSLAMNKPLRGPYPIFSTRNEILGHVDVNISIKTPQIFADGSSIVPTSDYNDAVSTTSEQRANNKENITPQRPDSKLATPSAFSSVLTDEDKQRANLHSRLSLSPPQRRHDVSPPRRHDVSPLRRQTSPVHFSPPKAVYNDLLSDLLVKGEKLKTAMTVATFDQSEKTTESQTGSLHLERHTVPERGRRPHLMRSGLHRRKVDLVLGSPARALYVSDSGDSLDDLQDPVVISDVDDPMHDSEMLDLLFYKSTLDSPAAPVPNCAAQAVAESREQQFVERPFSQASSVDHPDNARPASRPSSAQAGRVTPQPIPLQQVSSSPRSPAPSLTGHLSDSNTSRVSFDMTPSDDEDSRSAAEGLSVEQLTLLARVSVARVHINKLTLRDRPITPVAKKEYKGRPPPSKQNQYGTYFVEYQFPVMAPSRDNQSVKTFATETVRAVSKKVDKDGNVTWNHHTVFPILFDGSAIEKWWSSMFIIKLHYREAGSRTASLIGSCCVQMKKFLQSLTFKSDLELAMCKTQKRPSSARKRRKHRRKSDLIGALKMSVQLDSDAPSFQTALRELQLNHERKLHPLLKPRPPTPTQDTREPEHVIAQSTRSANLDEMAVRAAASREAQSVEREDERHLLLYSLLQIRECVTVDQKSSPLSTGSLPSTYALVRAFWSNDKIRSPVVWNETNPNFNMSELMPVTLNSELLSRMANNFMIVEVWQKRKAPAKDLLMGISKIPLNSIYMAFKEKRITTVLLKAQYPVICADGNLDVTNPLTGRHTASLKVLFAIGSQSQVMSLQALKQAAVFQSGSNAELGGIWSPQELPVHDVNPIFINHARAAGAPETTSTSQGNVEHKFEVKILGLRHFSPDDEMFWGEADCFIQYHFPTQSRDYGSLNLQPYRSGTTLCMSDCTFNHYQLHKFLLGADVPLQSHLLSADNGVHGPSLSFEVWCRFYHPNTRDQMMAKGLLPLAKLCAMVTMKGNSHSFTLPLISSDRQPNQVGSLDFVVRYLEPVLVSLPHSTPSRDAVTLRVTLNSVAGLRSAALALRHKHPCLDYFSTVGLNFYARVSLSFQPIQEVRVTDTVARILYLEDWNYTTQFSLPLVINNSTSLAESLQSGHLIVEIWHQSVRDELLEDIPYAPDSSDIHVGVCSAPLMSLLSRKSGVTGWFPVNPPPTLVTCRSSHDPLLGGVKLTASFSGPSDLHKVVDTASRLGYQINVPSMNSLTEMTCDEMSEFVVEVDWLTVPANQILLSLQEEINLTTACYIKTHFYNNDVYYSHPLSLVDRGENLESNCYVKRTYQHNTSAAYLWYLFESQLEIQLWVSYDAMTEAVIGDAPVTPTSRDKYLGSAFVALEPLSRRSRCAVSDVYPLYNPTCERMGRSMLQVHLSRRPAVHPDIHSIMKRPVLRDDPSTEQEVDSDLDETLDLDNADVFQCTIKVEEASRLNIKPGGDSIHVTYSHENKEYKVDAVPASSKPQWRHQEIIKLSIPAILTAKHLVLKVWHTEQASSNAKVLGFTTVDLRTLLSGMPEISGWYNIIDFTGMCQGQLKIGVTPLKVVNKRLNRSTDSQDQLKENRESKKPFTTSSNYSSFPDHISRFTEQRIQLSTVVSDSTVGSTSFISSNPSHLLRKQLSELDDITTNLRRRLYTPSSLAVSQASKGVSYRDIGHLDPVDPVCDPVDLAQYPATFDLIRRDIPDDAGTVDAEVASQKSSSSAQSLLETVFAVQRNVQELVDKGLVDPSSILYPPVNNQSEHLSLTGSQSEHLLLTGSQTKPHIKNPSARSTPSNQSPQSNISQSDVGNHHNDPSESGQKEELDSRNSEIHLPAPVTATVSQSHLSTLPSSMLDSGRTTETKTSSELDFMDTETEVSPTNPPSHSDITREPLNLARTSESMSPSEVTPRTQTTYSLSSDDEQFSPPIHRSRGSCKAVECSTAQRLDFREPLAPLDSEPDLVTTEDSGNEQHELSEAENGRESEGDYEEEEAHSRTINEDVSLLAKAPPFIQHENDPELSADNTMLQSVQPQHVATQERARAFAAGERLDNQPITGQFSNIQSMTDQTSMRCPATEPPHEDPTCREIFKPMTESDSGYATAHANLTTRSGHTMAGSRGDKQITESSSHMMSGAEDRTACSSIRDDMLSELLNQKPPVEVSAGRRSAIATMPITVPSVPPSFFPSMEQLEEKMRAVMTHEGGDQSIKNSSEHRFSSRTKSDACRRDANSTRRIAAIFSQQFS